MQINHSLLVYNIRLVGKIDMATTLTNNGNNPKINYSQENFALTTKLFEYDAHLNSNIAGIESLVIDLQQAIRKGGISRDEIDLKIMYVQTQIMMLKDYLRNKTFSFRLEEQVQSTRVLKLLDQNEAAYSTDRPF